MRRNHKQLYSPSPSICCAARLSTRCAISGSFRRDVDDMSARRDLSDLFRQLRTNARIFLALVLRRGDAESHVEENPGHSVSIHTSVLARKRRGQTSTIEVRQVLPRPAKNGRSTS